jgi:hypothetical protein
VKLSPRAAIATLRLTLLGISIRLPPKAPLAPANASFHFISAPPFVYRYIYSRLRSSRRVVPRYILSRRTSFRTDRYRHSSAYDIRPLSVITLIGGFAGACTTHIRWPRFHRLFIIISAELRAIHRSAIIEAESRLDQDTVSVRSRFCYLILWFIPGCLFSRRQYRLIRPAQLIVEIAWPPRITSRSLGLALSILGAID